MRKIILAVSIALLCAACGGDGSSSDSIPTPPSTQQNATEVTTDDIVKFFNLDKQQNVYQALETAKASLGNKTVNGKVLNVTAVDVLNSDEEKGTFTLRVMGNSSGKTFTKDVEYAGFAQKPNDYEMVSRAVAAWKTDVNYLKDFDFDTGLSASCKLGVDWITLTAGITQSIDVSASPSEKDYYLTNGFYTSLAFDIYKNQTLGTITWTPYFGIDGNWKFTKITKENKKGLNINWSHSFGMGKVNWINNFRQGFTVNIDNSYKYNTYKKGNVDVSFNLQTKGFYSFLERVGLYGRFDFFYNLFGKTSSEHTGKILRGILNKRIETDTAFSFNFDVPIKIGVFKWEEITGVEWTRFFGFELHITPFFDMALVHDKNTDTYYNPKHGWYSGGFEIIMYPIKMRSIYARISYGHDLREIKNKDGYAKRDGKPVSEIFIGIGLHY